MGDYQQYFDPQILAKLDGLELKARTIVEGYLSGRHKSPFHGFSIEFAEHREYVPGDDLRYVDWKIFGKRDRFYLKQYEEETNFVCYLLIDASESMMYQSEGVAVSKWEYASWVAAALAYLIVRQQDAAGLVIFDGEIQQFLNAGSQPALLKQFCHLLEITRPQGQTQMGELFHELAERISRRSLVVVISDFFDDLNSLTEGLKHFRYKKHDVSLLQVIDPAEEDFPFQSPMLFKGLEGLPQEMADPRTLQKAYQQEFQQFQFELKSLAQDLQLDFGVIRTDQSLDQGLTRFLTHRAKRNM